MSYKWIKIQTHVHTINSDGMDTLKAMAYAASKNAIDVILLTDHNTMYGYKDIKNIKEETGIEIIKCIEYTTFYGHIISIGAPYFRWENLKQNSLNELADHIHRNNGIIGIAHPMAMGDPVCTGGRYTFKNTDFRKIDFVEEWHGVTDIDNEWEKNKEFWEDKIEKGHMITTVYGGDLHRKEHFDESDAFNWMLVDETKELEGGIIAAIRSGKVIMSKGPCFNMKIQRENGVYEIGDIVEINKDENLRINIEIEESTIKSEVALYLTNNLGEKIEVNFNNKVVEVYGNNKLKWIRGMVLDKISEKILAKSNPIYISCKQ